jgi:hypothetical protein
MACNFTSKNQKALRSHISSTQHSSNYHCPYCGMGFPSFNAVMEHTKDLHNKDSLFPCIKCKGVSLTKNDYDMHKCGEALTSQYEIDKMKENNEFKCEVCTSNFKVKEHYEIHLLTICDGKEKYFCEICVKLFKTRKQLYHHNRLHGNLLIMWPIKICAFHYHKFFKSASLKSMKSSVTKQLLSIFC